MTKTTISNESLGKILFPQFATLYDLISSEIEDLSDQHLDWDSDRWEWSKWSIRRQLSHMASVIYRWLVLRWGDVLFPDDTHGIGDLKGLADSSFNRRMDEDRYWEMPIIMNKLKEAIDLTQCILSERNVGFLRSHTYLRSKGLERSLTINAHPTGIISADEPGKELMTLEATIRHVYFEQTTHLYNIQRLKRAQGLQSVVNVPKVGYWILDGWDRSEP